MYNIRAFPPPYNMCRVLLFSVRVWYKQQHAHTTTHQYRAYAIALQLVFTFFDFGMVYVPGGWGGGCGKGHRHPLVVVVRTSAQTGRDAGVVDWNWDKAVRNVRGIRATSLLFVAVTVSLVLVLSLALSLSRCTYLHMCKTYWHAYRVHRIGFNLNVRYAVQNTRQRQPCERCTWKYSQVWIYAFA